MNLASRARLKTVSDIKEEIPEWLWADKHSGDILKALEPIDLAWEEDNARRQKTKPSMQKLVLNGRQNARKSTSSKPVKRQPNKGLLLQMQMLKVTTQTARLSYSLSSGNSGMADFPSYN